MAGLTERVVGEGEVEARRRRGLWLLGRVRSFPAGAWRMVASVLVPNSLLEALMMATDASGYRANGWYGELGLE
jgi:hypothetical protein